MILGAKKFIALSKSDFALATYLGGTLLIYVSLFVLLWLTPFIQTGRDILIEELMFGWLIKLLILLAVGLILALAGNKLNSNKTPLIGIFSFVALPTLFLSAIVLLGVGLRDLIIYETPSWVDVALTSGERFAWVITFLILVLMTWLIFIHLWKNSDKRALVPFAKSVKIAGWIFLPVALIIFILGVITFDFIEFDSGQFIKIILEPVTYGIIGGVCLIAFGKLKSIIK